MTDGLTQMPKAGLDDLTPERIARELRGALYQAERDRRNALQGGDAETIRLATKARDDLMLRCDAEGVPYGPLVNGELFAFGYTTEAAAYEQRTRDGEWGVCPSNNGGPHIGQPCELCA